MGQIGNQSFDAFAGPITNTFDFNMADYFGLEFGRILILDPTSGEPIGPNY